MFGLQGKQPDLLAGKHLLLAWTTTQPYDHGTYLGEYNIRRETPGVEGLGGYDAVPEEVADATLEYHADRNTVEQSWGPSMWTNRKSTRLGGCHQAIRGSRGCNPRGAPRTSKAVEHSWGSFTQSVWTDWKSARFTGRDFETQGSSKYYSRGSPGSRRTVRQPWGLFKQKILGLGTSLFSCRARAGSSFSQVRHELSARAQAYKIWTNWESLGLGRCHCHFLFFIFKYSLLAFIPSGGIWPEAASELLPDRVGLLDNLWNCLSCRYQRIGNVPDLEAGSLSSYIAPNIYLLSYWAVLSCM